MELLTAEGQLKIGDKITIIGKNTRDDQYVDVMRVLNINGKEEIVFNVFHNKYFITSMVLDGSSWVKQVQIHQAN